MRILVTGSNGFVGRNLMRNLREIRDGRDRTRPGLGITDIYGHDRGSDPAELERACGSADFVFHLAGVNRPGDPAEFMEGNRGFTGRLLGMLEKHGNACPVMFAGSVQACLAGRFAGSEYGRSKLAGEGLVFRHARETGARALVYRFPNLFGKWCRPDYNSAVATFCHAVANGLAYTVNDPDTELELLYIDDLVGEMLDALEGREHRCEYEGPEAVPAEAGRYCYVPVTHRATLGRVVELLHSFKSMPSTLLVPGIPGGSFEKKLFSTFLSYLPEGEMAYTLRPHADRRGQFTELIRTAECGQVSVSVTKPGVTRGQHWHNSKWEIFVVVSGHGLIRERRVGTDPGTGRPYPVAEFEVSGERMQAVRMLPGYTHSITNLSGTQDLVTVVWANEPFDEGHPDTFYEPVDMEGASRRGMEEERTWG